MPEGMPRRAARFWWGLGLGAVLQGGGLTKLVRVREVVIPIPMDALDVRIIDLVTPIVFVEVPNNPFLVLS